jgi:glycosyltransferase involved in cell wall biosynthesis
MPARPLKVLLISHTCQSLTEGQPKAQILGRLPGIELRVLTPSRWKHYGKWRTPQTVADATFGYEVRRPLWAWVGPAQNYLHWYPALASLLREFRPDVIDLWEEPWGLVSAHACWLRGRLLPEARIISETEQNIDKRLPLPFQWLRAYTLRHADHAVARNREAVGVLRVHGYDGPAEVVGNGVDAALFRPMDREACRRELGVNGFVAGYVGRLVEEKGLTDMVDALPHCPAGVNLVFVGSGGLRAELERRANVLGVLERVRFLPPRPLPELPQVMNALDCLVLPSRTTARWKEQFGRVIIEAQACGTPVVASCSGAIPEVVGEGGIIVPEKSPVELAAGITRLAADPALARRLGAAGHSQVHQNYTWERVAGRMADIYHRVVDLPRLKAGRSMPGAAAEGRA